MIRGLLLLIMILPFGAEYHAQQAVGHWQDQLSYRSVYQIVDAGDRMYCGTGQGMFEFIDSSGELIRHSKVSGLSDVGVSALSYSEEQEILLVGYANGNLDLLRSNGILNLGDIKRSALIGDKGINRITIQGTEAWLACGFGIVVIDLEANEVKDTYFIAPGGVQIKVEDVLVEDDYVYASTEQGILRAERSTNLSDFFNWNLWTEIPNSTGAFKRIVRFKDWLIVQSVAETPAVYASNGGAWSAIPGTWNLNLNDIQAGQDHLSMAYSFSARVWDEDLSILYSTVNYNPGGNTAVLACQLDQEDKLWIGDRNLGLVGYDSDTEFSNHQPSGPFNDKAWQITAGNGSLYISHGELTATYNNTFTSDGFSSKEEGQWSNTFGIELFQSVQDIVDLRIDPLNPDRKYAASFIQGVVEHTSSSDNYTLYNEAEGNSNLTYSSLNPERIQVGSMEFDATGNLWMTNSFTPEPFKVRRTNGSWSAFECVGVLSGSSLIGEMVITEEGQTWTVLPRGSGLAVFQHNNDLENTANHQCKRFSTAVGDGALPTSTVLSIAKDLDGEIWLGTSEGPVVNYSPLSVFANNPVDFQSILVERDGNVERLLGNESISAIEVDGANRKWIGTLTGGLFLLSEDGTEEIHHFTTDNSPLFSDVIKDIAIDQSTGAVHIATDKGTLTYMSDATGGGEENECYDVFPNPVRPGYAGPITIDGLVRDSEVKITDIAGNIIFQSISNGGRVVWQGTDFSGNRVSTGVYFALVSDREASTTCISKILFIN